MNKTLTILCVEDDPDQRVIISLCLKMDPDMDVECASSPVEALSMAQSMKPDLILLDNSLPGTSGVELSRQLRAGGYDRAIIFLTASAEPEAIAHLAGGTIRGVIAKPFQPLALAGTIRSLMER